MKHTVKLPYETLPKPRTNPLADLGEFVITVIEYTQQLQADGTTITVPVRRVVRG
jgi:hypothetical protein